MNIVVTLEEAERQLVLRALAEQFLACPGFDDAHLVIAEKMHGAELYEEFKKLFSDRIEATK